MLEILNCPSQDRNGEAKIATSNAYRGCFTYIKGFDSEGTVLLDLPVNSAQAVKAIYPINKYYFPEDFNDTSDAVDKLKKNDLVVYYSKGDFITDRWSPQSFFGGAAAMSAYWASVEKVSSSFGYQMYRPGGASAEATLIGKGYAWVATGTGRTDCKPGYLVGTSVGTFHNVAAGALGRTGWVAQVTGIYYGSSADAKLRFKIGGQKYAV